MSTTGQWMKNHNLLIGVRFGRLIVESLHCSGSNTKYNVVCDCGSKTLVYKRALTSGSTKSCGCLKIEMYLNKGKETSFKNVLSNYKRNAKLRGYNFDLTVDQFKELTKQNCYYCNQEPIQKRKTTKYQVDYIYNGIDRKDNTVGYNIDNCVTCCQICNTAKSDLTLDQFYSWIKRLKNVNIT